MSLNPTIKFYTEILTDIGVQVDEEGLLQVVLPNNEVKYISDTKSKRKVAMPLNELLRKHPDGYTYFHPLSESITRGEPRITQLLRGWITYHLGSLSQELAHELMEVAVDPERQRKLTARQSVFLEFVGKTTNSTLNDLGRVISAAGKPPSNRFVNISLAKSTDTTQNWYRQASISFPVMEGDEDEAPFGVKNVSKTSARAIRGMLRYVFGTLGEIAATAPNKCAVIGSDNSIAPYFDALLQTLIEFGSMYQDFIRLHKKVLSPGFIERATFKLEWVDQLKDLETLRKRIPLIDVDDEETKSATKTVKRPKVQAGTAAPVASAPSWAVDNGTAPAAPTQQQQAYLPPTAPTQAPAASTGGARSAMEFLKTQQQQQQQQNFNPYQQQHPGYGQPQQHPQMGYGQPQPQMGYGQQMLPQQQMGYGQPQQQMGFQQPNAGNMLQQRMNMATQQAYMNAQQQQPFGGFGGGFQNQPQQQMGFQQQQMFPNQGFM